MKNIEIAEITEISVRVRNLQEMLRYLSYSEREPTFEVAVTGVYNAETEEAVKVYRESRGLPVTGVVDRRTWDSIAREYRYEREGAKPIYVELLRGRGELRPGERSDEVLILQLVLNGLRSDHGYPYIPLSGIYGVETMEAVREFQEVNLLPPTGIADRRTLRRLTAAA